MRVNGQTMLGKAFELKAVTSPGGTITGIRANRTDLDVGDEEREEEEEEEEEEED